MSQEPRGTYRMGGLSFIASGAVFFARHLFDVAAGPPPSSGAAILEWVAASRGSLMMANEALFVATALLVPAVAALYLSLAGVDRPKALVGCGFMAAAIPVLAALDIVHGRLIFPVYGLWASAPATAELVVATFQGGMHAVQEFFVVATVAVSLVLRRLPRGRGVAYLGFATAAFDFIGSYPWAVGPAAVLVSQLLFSAWFVAVGWRLYRTAE